MLEARARFPSGVNSGVVLVGARDYKTAAACPSRSNESPLAAAPIRRPLQWNENASVFRRPEIAGMLVLTGERFVNGF